MKTIKLLSWHEDIEAKASTLKHRGLVIDSAPLIKTSAVIGELARLNPAALILDLDKLPSNSRAIAILLRTSKAARHIPILFAGGLPEKIARIRAELPDAHYATWPKTPRTLATLLQQPIPIHPITFKDTPSTTPLPKKLGIRPHMQIALIAAPDGFEELLGDLPEDTSLTPHLTPQTRLALCFIRSLDDLAATLDLLTLRLPAPASVWIIHPKRTARHHVDFHQNHIREAALAANLVDYKVCSVDNVWSALKFAHRKSPAVHPRRKPHHPEPARRKSPPSTA